MSQSTTKPLADKMDFIASYAPPPIFLSPAAHLLDMERLPSVHETSAIRDAVARAERHLSRYKKSIKQISAELDRVVTERDALRQLTKWHLAVIAPVRRCPPEILSEIFRRCLPVSALHRDNWETPVAISHVNRQWRKVAVYMTPQLWVRISACLNTPDFRVSQTTTWMERSGNLPMSVHFDGLEYNRRPVDGTGCNHCDSDQHLDYGNFDQVLGSVVKSSPRWETASLRLQWPHMEDLYPIKNSIPSLRCLKYEGRLFNERKDDPQPYRYFKNAPQLRSVQISHNYLDSQTILAALPCLQIKRLVLQSANTTFALSYISHMENLVTFICRDITPKIELVPEVVIHKNLRTFCLQVDRPTDAKQIWRRLTLPGLQNLWVDGQERWDSDGLCWTLRHRDFTDFIRRSSCHLHTLCLVNVNFTQDDYWLDILRLVPTIVDLHFGWALEKSFTDYPVIFILQDPTANDGESKHLPVCPNLQDITLHGRFSTDVDVFLSLSYLARCRGTHGSNVKAIKTMTFNIPSKTPPATISQLRSLESISVHQLRVHIDHSVKRVAPPGDWDDPQEDEC